MSAMTNDSTDNDVDGGGSGGFGGGEALGWMAAIAAMLAFGSFGVPIKSDAANSVNVDPLVFQSYKSFMCFATSWLVLLTGKVPLTYTPWGIVSCIFWVPGGVATVYAIRNAGLAIAIGIGSSSIVLVSFIWGIFIFREDIHSQLWASVAIGMMMMGISGMSYYSSPKTTVHQRQQQGRQLIRNGEDDFDDDDNDDDLHPSAQFVPMRSSSSSESPTSDNSRRRSPPSNNPSSNKGYEGVDLHHRHQQQQSTGSNSATQQQQQQQQQVDVPVVAISDTGAAFPTTAAQMEQFQEEYNDDEDHPSNQSQHQQTSEALDPTEIIYVMGKFPCTRRQIGIAGAVFNGVWGGSIMAPMHFCHDDNTSGVGYLISFGIGAAIVTTALWIVRYIGNLIHYNGNTRQAYNALPSFHLKIMWCAGGTSGLLWSIGNFFSLISVYYLGEGVGYSVIQAGMLVSGLWGIFLTS